VKKSANSSKTGISLLVNFMVICPSVWCRITGVRIGLLLPPD